MGGGLVVMVVSSATGFNYVFQDDDGDQMDVKALFHFQMWVSAT